MNNIVYESMDRRMDRWIDGHIDVWIDGYEGFRGISPWGWKIQTWVDRTWTQARLKVG